MNTLPDPDAEPPSPHPVPDQSPAPTGAGRGRRLRFAVWMVVGTVALFLLSQDTLAREGPGQQALYFATLFLTAAGLWWIWERFRHQPLRPRSGVLIAILTGVTGGCLTALAIQQWKQYGYGVFIVAPLIIGYSAGWLYTHGQPRPAGRAFRTALGALGVCGLTLLTFRIEGLACIIMAALPVLFFALLGCGLAVTVRMVRDKPERGIRLGLLLVLLLPLTLSLESAIPTGSEGSVTTSIEIDAPPDVVWQYIPAFPDIPDEPSLTFRAGLACPVRSEMTGSGIGATRRCVLTTGAMEEKITGWDPGHSLEFTVLNTPAPMTEMSPWENVDAAHLDGYFRCHRGRFVLTALPGGRTRVEGTSWFSHEVRPAAYWDPITRHIVREVHLRVLAHIRNLAEAARP